MGYRVVPLCFLVAMCVQLSLSISFQHPQQGMDLEAKTRLRVEDGAVLDLNEMAVRDLDSTVRTTTHIELIETSVVEPSRAPEYPGTSNPPDTFSDDSNSTDYGSITGTGSSSSITGHGVNAYFRGSKLTFMSGQMSAPTLPSKIVEPYGPILYSSFGLSSANYSFSALLSYPDDGDEQYTGFADWTFYGYITTPFRYISANYSFPVTVGDTIYAEIHSNGHVHSIVGHVNGAKVFNLTGIVDTTLIYAGVGTQNYIFDLPHYCENLPSGHVQYFEDLVVKSNGNAINPLNWKIEQERRVCNDSLVCCNHECLAYWNNPSTDLTCAQVHALYDHPATTAPTTHSPTTKPTTHGPTTKHPTTHKPTTGKPTTHKPTTSKPTTRKPTTHKPTTHKPTTH